MIIINRLKQTHVILYRYRYRCMLWESLNLST